MTDKSSNWYGHFFKKDPKPSGWICGTPFLEQASKDLILSESFDTALRVSKYRFSCKFHNDTQLPPYKGLIYKNALEQALKNVSCGLREKDCQNCAIKRGCLYSQMSEVSEERLRISKAFCAFLPYIIEVPDSEKIEFSAGESFAFDLVLFGMFGSSIPNLIYAVQEMGQIGIGKAGDGTFELESVVILNQEIYSSSDKIIHTELLDGKSITICDNRLLYYTRLWLNESCKIKIITPLKYQIGNTLITETPTFWQLIKPILNRLKDLAKLYGTCSFIDYKKIQAAAEEIKIISSNVKWVKYDATFYDQDSPVEGLVGEIEYSGNLEPFQSILAIGEVIHLGQQSYLGLGKIEVDEV